MKKLVRALAFVAALLVLPTTVAHAADPRGLTGVDETTGKIAIYMDEGKNVNNFASYISNESIKSDTHPPYCRSFTTDGCAATGVMLDVNAQLAACVDAQENCIEGLSVYKTGQEKVAAKFLRYVDGIKFDAPAGSGLISGSTVSIWQAPNVTRPDGGDKYAVNVILEYFWDGSSLRPLHFTANVTPIIETTGDFKTMFIGPDPFSQDHALQIQGGSDYCAAAEANYCAKASNFADTSRVSLSLRLSKKVTGWLYGRLKSPSIDITSYSASTNKVVVDAEPVVVPQLWAVVNKDTVDKAALEQIYNLFHPNAQLLNNKTFYRKYQADLPGSRAIVAGVKAEAKDTAYSTENVWMVSSIYGTQQNPCLNDTSRLLGLVTTNAMAYSGNTPEFKDGQLTYSVAGMHYLPDGKTAVSGSYDLVMRSEVARCLYGFSSAPISATINVVSDNGEAKIATTIVSENAGWLKLAAYDFGFSSPTINVKLTQASSKKITITCVKGKTTKKVTAVAAKCPAGYKKK